MKNLFYPILISISFLIQQRAFANDFGLVGGLRFDNADSGVATRTVDPRMNFQGGAVGFIELGGKNYLRGSFVFTTRSFGTKNQNVNVGDARFTYFDFAVTGYYRWSDYGGLFVGPVAAFNFSKECPSGTCTGVSSAPIGIQFGTSFKFAPQFGAECYFEMLGSKLADGYESPKALVAQLLVTFE